MDRESQRAFAIGSLLTVLLFITCQVGSCVARSHANPVERILARCRIERDGLQGIFRAGGTIDSVEYHLGAGYAARRDSAQLWIQVMGVTSEPPESTAAHGTVSGAPTLDAAGSGYYEWVGLIEAIQFYRAAQPLAPGDTAKAGTWSGDTFKDDGAFVRITYQASVVTDVTAWGVDALRYPDTDGYAVDDGVRMIPAAGDTTRFWFHAASRDRGLRYVLKTRAAWQAGVDRWLRLELSRDTTALGTLQP